MSRAELGRATWKLLHTMMSKFPDKPSPDERAALENYIHLFARLYPWYTIFNPLSILTLRTDVGKSGECAEHFQQIISKYPPQVSSRSAAATWACHVHNEVNKSLKKPLFDCMQIGDFYDCGCADDNAGNKHQKPSDDKPRLNEARKSVMKGEDDVNFTPLKLEKDG